MSRGIAIDDVTHIFTSLNRLATAISMPVAVE